MAEKTRFIAIPEGVTDEQAARIITANILLACTDGNQALTDAIIAQGKKAQAIVFEVVFSDGTFLRQTYGAPVPLKAIIERYTEMLKL